MRWSVFSISFALLDGLLSVFILRVLFDDVFSIGASVWFAVNRFFVLLIVLNINYLTAKKIIKVQGVRKRYLYASFSTITFLSILLVIMFTIDGTSDGGMIRMFLSILKIIAPAVVSFFVMFYVIKVKRKLSVCHR